MIIDQLPLLSGNAASTDECPIERGTTTYKVTLDRLLAALPKDAVPTEDGTNVVESGGVYSALATKQDKINASGILKGNGSTVSAATLGSDYTAIDDTLSSSNTKTYSITKQRAAFVPYDKAITLTTAQQTRARGNIGANWTLLWQNASPTNDFAPQSITVNGLSDYAMIAIAFKTYKADAAVTINLVPYDAGGTRDFPIFNVYLIQRVITWVNNTITFGDCWEFRTYGSYTTTTNNGYLVPYKIYGVNN